MAENNFSSDIDVEITLEELEVYIIFDLFLLIKLLVY